MCVEHSGLGLRAEEVNYFAQNVIWKLNESLNLMLLQLLLLVYEGDECL